MSVNTYARLEAPAMFRPVDNENVSFRLYYSEDLTGGTAIISINGYNLGVNGNNYGGDGYTQQRIINTSHGGVRYEDFTFDSGTFGETPLSSWTSSGKMKATVNITNGSLTAESNTVLTDMLICVDNSFSLSSSTLTTNSSNYTVEMILSNSTCFGKYGDNELNSYMLELYDADDNLIEQTETMYDWITTQSGYHYYTFENLKDDTIYKIKAKCTLVSGFEFESNTITITVNYDEHPADTELVLTNKNGGYVEVSADLTSEIFTKYIISKCKKNSEDWITLETKNTSDVNILYKDYYAIPDVKFTYRLQTYNGATLVETYYNEIEHTFEGCVIADYYGAYFSDYDLETLPINKNERMTTVETLDSKYAYGIINGAADYESGSVKGLFTELRDDCKPDFNRSTQLPFSIIMLDWLNKGNAKFLKFGTGQAWIIYITGAPSVESDDGDVLSNTQFSWTECADVFNSDVYPALGLTR